MKCLLLFAAATVIAVSALPVTERDSDDDLRERRSLLAETELEENPFKETDEQGSRAKRATCDATSFTSKWLTINHSACAIHCIVKGYKGGKCKNTICHCRN